jgi:TPP-dependent pyruvate/acetoin dehydrogenase alpha subunit
MWTVERLQEFETDIKDTFNRGEIRAPVHLGGGNEQWLIDYFARENIGPLDWVCGTWRFHLHCLLKGVPSDELKAAILEGRSISLCFRGKRLISSAMVGGIIPIAVGIAWDIKREGSGERVFCFIGDMANMSGIAHECCQYARGHGLPLYLVVEDNGKSVATDTLQSWGVARDFGAHYLLDRGHFAVCTHELPYPHVGTGTWIHMQ